MKRIILGSVLAASALAALPASAKVLWRGDFSTGDLSQWQSAQEVSKDRLQVVGMDGGNGFALKVTVHQGDNPIHASGNRNELEAATHEPEGSERWYHWQTLWPADYPTSDSWQLFTQFHHTGSNGSPPVEMFVKGGRIILNVQSREEWSAPLVRGQWHDFLLHVKWSSAVNQGFVQLEVDGKQVLDRREVATMFPGQGVYLKQGLYRDASIQPTATLFQRGMVVGETRADVTQAAHESYASQSMAQSASGGGGGGGCSNVGAGALALFAAAGLMLVRRQRSRARALARAPARR